MSNHLRNDELAAKVVAVNIANDYANKLYDMLAPIFAPLVGKQIDKASGGLMEKYKKLLPELPCDPKLHVYRSGSDYSLVYCVKANAPIGGDDSGPHTVTYHEVSVYIGNMRNGVLTEITPKYERRTDYTLEAVLEARRKCKEAKRAYEDLKSACEPFGEGY